MPNKNAQAKWFPFRWKMLEDVGLRQLYLWTLCKAPPEEPVVLLREAEICMLRSHAKPCGDLTGSYCLTHLDPIYESHAQVPGDWSQKDLMSFHLSLGMEEFQSATWSELRTPLVTDHNVRLELLPDFLWVQTFASPADVLLLKLACL